MNYLDGNKLEIPHFGQLHPIPPEPEDKVTEIDAHTLAAAFAGVMVFGVALGFLIRSCL